MISVDDDGGKSSQLMITQKQKAICVLGMHRSGTSAVARAVNLLGAYIGRPEKLMPPKKGNNPEGFWEYLNIVNFHERLFQVLSRFWDDIVPLPEEWWKQPEIEPYHKELLNLIRKEFSDHPLWMWKDPRTSLFLPLWMDVLNELEVDAYYLISLRNPLDVAASLKKRDGFPKNKSFALWQLYNLSSFCWTNKSKRLVLCYDNLLEDWEQCLRNVAKAFAIPWPQDDKELRTALASFLKSGLRHSYSNLESLISDRDVPEPVISAYRLFIEAEKSKEFLASEEFSKRISKLFVEYCTYTKMINPITVRESVQPQTIQVYWPSEGIFSEENSAHTDVIADGEFHYYDLPVISRINAPLRLDPVSFPAYVEIKSIELFCNEIKSSKKTSLLIQWSPDVNYNGLSIGPNIIRTNNKYKLFSFIANSNDPQLFLENIPSYEGKKVMHLRVFMRVDKQISINLAEQIAEMQAMLVEREERLSQQAEQIREMQARLVEREERLNKQAEQITEIRAGLVEGKERLNRQAEQIAEMQASLVEKEEQLIGRTEQIACLNANLVEKEMQLVQIFNSTSWRITAPFRWFRGLLLKLFKRET